MTQANRQPVLRGLYVITDNRLIGGAQLIPAVTQALQGGARLVQYRDKTDEHSRRFREASALLALCRQAQVPLIINDDIELAASVGADGVHLGEQDGSLAEARAVLGKDAIIGISCYDDLERARQCHADYVAFGRFFSSSTKPFARPASPEVLSTARRTLNKPIAAIGGITAGNAEQLRNAGADMLAVVAGVFGEQDVRRAASRLAALYPEN